MDLLVFLVPLVTGLVWAGSGAYHLMAHNELRRRGIRSRVVGPVPGVPASHSRGRGDWVINPLLSFTTPDGRTVEQGVGSRKRPIRARAHARVTVFHSADDPRELAVDGHGVRGRACTEIVLGVFLAVAVALLMSRVV